MSSRFVARAQDRTKGLRIEKDIHVLRKAPNQIPALRQAGASLEDDLLAIIGRDDSEDFGDVVVLLDDRRPQPAITEVFRRLQDCLLEVGMLEQFHGFACQAHAWDSPRSMPNSNCDTGFSDSRRRRSTDGFLPSS